MAATGHRVRFISVTHGDASHQSEGGGALAMRRRAEFMEAGKRIDVEYLVLDNHNGVLLPTLQKPAPFSTVAATASGIGPK